MCDASFINKESPLFGELASRLHTMMDAFVDGNSDLTSIYRYFDTCVDPYDSAYRWFVYSVGGQNVSIQDAMALVDWSSGGFSLDDIQTDFDRGIDSLDADTAWGSFEWAMKHAFMMKIADVIYKCIVDAFNDDYETAHILIKHKMGDSDDIFDMDDTFVMARYSDGMRRITMKELLAARMDIEFIDAASFNE